MAFVEEWMRLLVWIEMEDLPDLEAFEGFWGFWGW